MKKFHNGIGDFLRGYLATLAGIFVSIVSPFGIIAFGALAGMGSFGKYAGYVVIGAAVGIVSQVLGSLTGSFLSFLPGVFGMAAGWLINGAVISFLVLSISRAFGAGRK